jgi:hypothetical protein
VQPGTDEAAAVAVCCCAAPPRGQSGGGVAGIEHPSRCRPGVAACRYRCCIALFRALLVQVTAPAPHTSGRLRAVSPDMAEFLAVVTLRETSLSLVRLYRDSNMAKACQFEYILGLCKVMRNRGRFTVDVPSAGDRRVADICLTLITSKPRSTNPSEMSSAGVVNGRFRITQPLCGSGIWNRK